MRRHNFEIVDSFTYLGVVFVVERIDHFTNKKACHRTK